MPGDQGEAQAELDGCDRCPDGPVHHPGCPGLHPFGQRSGVHRRCCQAMDQGGRRRDRLHRTRLTLGERILRELQRPVPGRAFERRNILQPQRSTDRHRAMAAALQHEAATFSPWIQTAGTRKHHPNGGKTDDALTFKLDQSTGAGQRKRYLSAFRAWRSRAQHPCSRPKDQGPWR
jgi:hypothetical protein